MNVAIITSGILPIPSVKGGAVETLVDYYLQGNNSTNGITFYILSAYDRKAESESIKFKNCKFIYFKPTTIYNRLKRLIFKNSNRDYYYDYYTDYYGAWAINKIKKLNIDLVIIENRQGFAINASKQLNLPIILHLHTDTLSKDSYQAESIVNSCDKIITVSNYIKRQVDTITPTSKSEVIHNGIDLSSYINPPKIYSRSDFHINDDDFVVIYTGRLVSIKGIRELVKAFTLLKEYPKIKLLIVGSINFGDNSYEDEYIKDIKEIASTILSQVIFTGFIEYSSIPSLLKIADIGIIPSICEDALTLSSIEDMAAGLPLIVTRSGGIPEAVDENCGIIVDKEDIEKLPNMLSEAIINLYNNPEKVKEMSVNAIHRSKLFSKEVYIEKIYKIINSYNKLS